MGVFISEDSLRRAEVGADLQERRLVAGRLYEPETESAAVLTAMLVECLRTGALSTLLPVPEWGAAHTKGLGQAPALEIAENELSDTALVERVLRVLGRAMVSDPEAKAVVAEIARRYGDFHGSAS